MKDSEFELNKIVGAILLAGVVAMSAAIISGGLYGGGHSAPGQEEKRGYTIAGAESAGGNSGAAAEDDKPVDIAPFMAKADVKAGEGMLKKCTSCHTFDKGGKDGVGPNQWGLVGSHFGHKDGYAYSAAITGMKDKKWDAQTLSDFLSKQASKAIPGTKMVFPGIKNPQDRANLIAYLSTLK